MLGGVFYVLVSGGGHCLSQDEHGWEFLKGRVSDVRQLKKEIAEN